MDRFTANRPPNLNLQSLSSKSPSKEAIDDQAPRSLQALVSPRNAETSTPRKRQPLVSPRPARIFTPRAKSLRSATLQSQLCGDQWAEVQGHLKGVKGLDAQESEIVATSKLDEQALDAIAAAIGILMKSHHSEAACILISMCKPALLLALLEKRDHVTKLNTSGDAEVREATDETLSAGARPALQRENFPRLFKLLSFCSPEARANKLTELSADLRAVVNQAKREQPCEENVNRLRELASLSNEINTEPAMALRFDIMRVLSTLSEEWQTAFESSGRSHLEVLGGLFATALPTLCDAGHSHDLDFILGTDQDRRSAAQAVIDCLSSKHCSDATITSLFAALAHRIDLSWHSSLSTLDILESRMKKAELGEDQLNECTQHLHQWLPGWRLLLAMNRNSHPFLEDDKRLREAAVAVDAAAAGVSVKAVEELPTRLDGWVQDALAAMLNVSVAGKPLLSDDALRNVMRAVLSDKRLAVSMIDWIEEAKRPEDGRTRLYKAAGNELMNDAACEIAAEVAYRVVDTPSVVEALASERGNDALKKLFLLATPKK